MKNFKNGIFILSMMLLTACSDDFLDVNGSTTNPPSSTPELTLPAAQKYTADMYYNANNAGNSFNLIGGIHAGIISDSGDRVWYRSEQSYIIINDTYQSLWNNTYSLPLNSYHFIEKYNGEGYDNYIAIAKIMKAFHFATLVDMYGDIIYSEAFQRGNNTQPAYDDDKAIYDAIYEELNVAIDMITNASPDSKTVSTDIILGGDMNKWQKFANTLKLRMLLRQVNTGENLTSKYNELVNNGVGFIESSVNVNPGYIDESNKQNPFYALHGFVPGGQSPAVNHGATRGSEFYIDFLNDNNDPRVAQLFLPVAGEFVGVPQNTYENAYASNLTSELGPALLNSSSQDAPLMLLSEALFLQAEAAQRGFIPGNAGDSYKLGIVASFSEMGVPNASTTALNYESNSISPIINWDSANGNGKQIEAIITQKWISGGFITGFEVWMDRVRTNFPSNIPIPPGAVSNIFPSNLLYPTSELSANSANVPAQGANAAFDRHTFWMQ
ncbi:SusD/RagB-like outer membrane lipoprotein [Gelidibacter algens]|uniref:SusD/RagB-like outer membrane lipoprotein n=1 Tax=Gelidibacter algens TaxID=49280 RepID=A0A327RSH7_9FLAO|nr:SusD/RagB family nutrient-binding outer membrane lipoprotein [Gelidibacter algens]RAJ19990.1 SusD/RagB-like outer membrane lipoprotein [Gelidibacter algens]